MWSVGADEDFYQERPIQSLETIETVPLEDVEYEPDKRVDGYRIADGSTNASLLEEVTEVLKIRECTPRGGCPKTAARWQRKQRAENGEAVD